MMASEHPCSWPAANPARGGGAFLAEGAEVGLSYASIDVACCAFSYRRRQEGLVDPTTDPTPRRVRRGLRRLIGAAPRRQAHPLNVAEIERIVTSIDPETPSGLRDRAIILLGSASAVRPSELSTLRLEMSQPGPGVSCS